MSEVAAATSFDHQFSIVSIVTQSIPVETIKEDNKNKHAKT